MSYIHPGITNLKKQVCPNDNLHNENNENNINLENNDNAFEVEEFEDDDKSQPK
jgi:hypothetical protein